MHLQRWALWGCVVRPQQRFEFNREPPFVQLGLLAAFSAMSSLICIILELARAEESASILNEVIFRDISNVQGDNRFYTSDFPSPIVHCGETRVARFLSDHQWNKRE